MGMVGRENTLAANDNTIMLNIGTRRHAIVGYKPKDCEPPCSVYSIFKLY